MTKNDAETTLQDLRDLVSKFREERNWSKHHTPKNLALSISIEAAELMEHFQWDDYSKSSQEDIADELADVLIYCFFFADATGIDISTAFKNKLEKAGKKYPVEIFHAGKDQAEDYAQVKQAYRSKKQS